MIQIAELQAAEEMEISLLSQNPDTLLSGPPDVSHSSPASVINMPG